MDIVDSLFYWKYSIGRTRFILSLITAFILFLVLFNIGIKIDAMLNSPGFEPFTVISILLPIYMKFCIYINRLHDIQKPSYWVIAAIIPLLNLLLLVYLLFKSGKSGEEMTKEQ